MPLCLPRASQVDRRWGVGAPAVAAAPIAPRHLDGAAAATTSGPAPPPSASPTKHRMWRPSRPRTAARPVRQRGRPTGMGGGRSPAPRRATEGRGDGSARPPTPPPPATCAPPVTSAADGAVAHGCGGKLRPAAAAAAAIVLWCRRCRGALRAPPQLSFFGHRRARGRGSRGCRLGVTSHGPCAMRRWRPLRRGWPHR